MQYDFKKWRRLGLITLQILSCGYSISHEQKTIDESQKKLNLSKDKRLINKDFSHSFGLALEHAYYHYKESDVMQEPIYNTYGAHWVTWKGNSWGSSIFYRLTWKNKMFAQPEIRLLYGKHQYNTGQKEKIHFKTKHTIPSLIFEPRLTIGGHVQVHKGLTLSPYSGMGYRFKSDNGDDAICNDGEKLRFYRKSNYIYVPLGTSAEYQLNDTWSLSFKGEYDWIVKAWHYSRMPTERPTTFKQPNGYGLKGEVSVSYLYKKVKFSISPYINYWNIRNSKEKNGGAMEPYNITFESGIKIGVTF